jgi:hypothetical protein
VQSTGAVPAGTLRAMSLPARIVGRRLSVARAALVALLVGALVTLYTCAAAPPATALHLVGMGSSIVDVTGGVEIEVTARSRLPAGELEVLRGALEERARALGAGAIARRRSDGHIVITLIPIAKEPLAFLAEGRPPEQLQHLAAAITRTVRLEFRVVVNDAPLMRALHDDASRGALGAEIVADTDSWPVDNGLPQRDVFLWSRDEAALRRAVAGRATDDAEIVLEPVEDERGPMWRTWLVHREVVLGTADVAEAIVSYDPNTTKPIVLLDFRDDGARRFGELTSANVGRRIAIVLDGRVSSAPVVNGPIMGGRASITMGAGTSEQVEVEAYALVAALTAGQRIPAGLAGRVTRSVATEPTRLRLAQALSGVAAAVLAFLIALPLSRRTASWPASTALPAGSAGARDTLRRAVVTIAVVGVLLALRWVPLPTLTQEGRDYLLLGDQRPAAYSVATLGILPLLSASVVVELLALVIPGWRRRRLAGYAARGPLRLAAGILATAVALAQAWYFVRFLQSLGGGVTSIITGTPLAGVATVVSIAAGVSLHALGALWITRHGIGHGLAVLAGVWIAGDAIDLIRADLDATALGVLAVEAALAAVLTAAVTRSRVTIAGAPHSVRLPASGLAPLSLAVSLSLLAGLLASLGATNSGGLDELAAAVSRSLGVDVVLTLSLAVALTWCFARPAPLRALGTPALASAAYLLALLGISALTGGATGASVALAVAFLTALALDLGAELRARWRTSLVAVEEHHDVHAADAALDAGGGFLRGVHLRALLRVFGPFVPVWRMVPAGQVTNLPQAIDRGAGGM